MRVMLLFLFQLLILLPSFAWSATILALVPSSSSPGEEVTVKGGPFSEESVILVGGQSVPTTFVAEGTLTFTVPSLPVGAYLLTLDQEQTPGSAQFILQINEPQPVIRSLNPSHIDACSSGVQRQVQIDAQQLLPGARLLVDGAVVSAKASENQLLFEAPPLTSGQHEVKLVNPGGQESLAYALIINTVPEILAVQPGEDNVTSYQLLIEGKNFSPDSQLLVNGRPVLRSAAMPADQDSVSVIDCTRIVYRRYPYSQEPKRVSLQVINPGGQQSPIFFVTIP